MKNSLSRYLFVLACLATLPLFLTGQTTDPDQPANEKLNLAMYQRIRDEGFKHSHVMEFASVLCDRIGPRLTGSPNMAKANQWTRDELAALGLKNAHLESWGEFGMGWQQNNTWVRMASPDSAPLIAQATPWSAATPGTVTGQAVSVVLKDESDFAKYRGKLAGKIVLLGGMREVGVMDQPLFNRDSDKDLAEQSQYPAEIQTPPSEESVEKRKEHYEFRAAVTKFLESERPLAVIVPSRDGSDHSGSGGTIFDDNGASVGIFPYLKQYAFGIPTVVMAIEHYGRMYRLLEAHVPVTVEMNVDTTFTGDHEQGYNTIAEIPGTDPRLKDQVVMVGGHLDSWAAATGATDNGAGSIVAMEVVRILETLDVHPRRTIRIALWSGEEEGLLGSLGYVKEHFGAAPLSQAPDQQIVPEFRRKVVGPIQLKPEWKTLDAYFNLDNGTGRIRGIYLQDNLALKPIFEQWIAPLNDLGVTTVTDRDTYGTDHLSFDGVGLPGFQFLQEFLDYGRTHHSNADSYDYLEPNDLAQAAVVEAIFVYDAAMRDQMLPRKPLPHPELEEKPYAPIPNVLPETKETPEAGGK